MWRIVPPGCFLDNRLNRSILNDRLDVDGIVHAAKDSALVGVWDIHVFKELQPECFQLLSVILKEIKVVADCRKNFVEVFLEIAAVFLDSQLASHLNLIGKLISILVGFCRGIPSLVLRYHGSGAFGRGIHHRWGLDLHLLDQVVLLCIFL